MQKTYPSDVTDEEWMFIAPYLTLMREDAPQREYSLRAVFNGLRYVVKTDVQWRFIPHDLPPWPVIYQQAQRWLAAGVFEAMVQDLRQLLRMAQGRDPQPSAAIFDSRTLQSTPENQTERRTHSPQNFARPPTGKWLAVDRGDKVATNTRPSLESCQRQAAILEAELTGEFVRWPSRIALKPAAKAANVPQSGVFDLMMSDNTRRPQRFPPFTTGFKPVKIMAVGMDV